MSPAGPAVPDTIARARTRVLEATSSPTPAIAARPPVRPSHQAGRRCEKSTTYNSSPAIVARPATSARRDRRWISAISAAGNARAVRRRKRTQGRERA